MPCIGIPNTMLKLYRCGYSVKSYCCKTSAVCSHNCGPILQEGLIHPSQSRDLNVRSNDRVTLFSCYIALLDFPVAQCKVLPMTLQRLSKKICATKAKTKIWGEQPIRCTALHQDSFKYEMYTKLCADARADQDRLMNCKCSWKHDVAWEQICTVSNSFRMITNIANTTYNAVYHNPTWYKKSS